MEDGQEVGKFAPDREADDPTDFEFNGGTPHAESADEAESSGDNSDSEETSGDAETDTADDDADTQPAAQGGTPTSSFEQFLAEWSDDDGLSKICDPTAAVHPKPPKVPAKRAAAASSSSANAPRKAAKTVPPATTTWVPTGQAQASRTKADQAPKGAPLNVAPLRFRLPTGAPKSAGYVLFFEFRYSSCCILLTCILL